MKRILLSTILALAGTLLLSACDIDNFEPPKSDLNGAVVYEGEQVGVSHGLYSLQLWEPGFELNDDIQVYLKQDGTFSQRLFDGEYNLVRRTGGGPWVQNTDSIRVSINGSNIEVNQGDAQVNGGRLEVAVQPYFVVENESINRSGSTVTASFGVSKEVSSATLQTVGLYVGSSRLVDESGSGSDAVATMSAGDISDTGNITLSVDVSGLEDTDPLFARVGVKAEESERLLYTQVVEL